MAGDDRKYFFLVCQVKYLTTFVKQGKTTRIVVNILETCSGTLAERTVNWFARQQRYDSRQQATIVPILDRPRGRFRKSPCRLTRSVRHRKNMEWRYKKQCALRRSVWRDGFHGACLSRWVVERPDFADTLWGGLVQAAIRPGKNRALGRRCRRRSPLLPWTRIIPASISVSRSSFVTPCCGKSTGRSNQAILVFQTRFRPGPRSF